MRVGSPRVILPERVNHWPQATSSRAGVYFWGVLMAAGILGSVPVAIAYAFLVDYDVSGLTAGATKG